MTMCMSVENLLGAHLAWLFTAPCKYGYAHFTEEKTEA